MAWGWTSWRHLIGLALLALALRPRWCCAVTTAYVGVEEAIELRDQVERMFYHAYGSYMQHAFPLDELRPMSCKGEDSLGGYALTLIDALDTLALLGNHAEFSRGVAWIGANLDLHKNKTVSLFETNIRVMGGLLSAHLLASDPATGMQVDGYDGELLRLAEDLGHRLLPAFDTPTGIPYGSINLKHGVAHDETTVTSTAGGGTLSVEFGVLSRLTGNPAYEEAARNAVRGLWAQRSELGLLGAHIDIFSGDWTQRDAGIGTSIDSFYEYLIKAHVVLGEDEYLHIFNSAYDSVMRHLFHDPWYVEVNMYNAVMVWPLFNSLQAFWPGLQVLVGDTEPAERTHRAFYSVWRRYGFTPEGFNLASSSVQAGQKSYPLRPELAESTYWLYKATRDPMYLFVGRDMVQSISSIARCPCGFCHVADVEDHTLDDHMESFFLAETVKYLWLLFDLAATDGDNLVENGPYPYVFTTEGHLIPLTAQISLPAEHCTYPGSFCPSAAGSSAPPGAREGSASEGGVASVDEREEKEHQQEQAEGSGLGRKSGELAGQLPGGGRGGEETKAAGEGGAGSREGGQRRGGLELEPALEQGQGHGEGWGQEQVRVSAQTSPTLPTSVDAAVDLQASCHPPLDLPDPGGGTGSADSSSSGAGTAPGSGSSSGAGACAGSSRVGCVRRAGGEGGEEEGGADQGKGDNPRSDAGGEEGGHAGGGASGLTAQVAPGEDPGAVADVAEGARTQSRGSGFSEAEEQQESSRREGKEEEDDGEAAEEEEYILIGACDKLTFWRRLAIHGAPLKPETG